MTYDPDRPNAHAEARAPVQRRPASTDAEARALDRLAAVTEFRSDWDATFAASVLANVARYGPSLSDAQWKHVSRIGRIAAPVPVPRSPLESECDEVESQLDELLRDPHGDRCLLAVEESGTGRSESIARVLGVGAGGDGPLAGTPRLLGYGFALCGSCVLGPSRACTRCAAGTPHPGEACDDARRNRACRGIAYLATLRAKILDARGLDGDEIRRDMGLENKGAARAENSVDSGKAGG